MGLTELKQTDDHIVSNESFGARLFVAVNDKRDHWEGMELD